MNKALIFAPCLLGALVPEAIARGVSPYLPLNLEPEMARQIERVLILGDKPVMTRPIAAATVLDALPKACKIDQALCEQVRRYLSRYTRPSNIVHASVEGGSSSDVTHIIPNRYGLTTSSSWAASAQVLVQPSDYALITLGGVAYDERTEPTGSVLSLGFDWAQLDIGYRDHWFSPLTDSAMLISTEAPTMPSVTLSNHRPLTRWGFQYELFVARMSESSNISFMNRTTTGNPQLAGAHIAIEPASGWSLAFNRLMQFGGGERSGSSLGDIFDAFLQPSQYDNAGDDLSVDAQFGNQAASFTSRFLYPGRTPFSVYFEYAGEDTSRGKNYLLGNSALSAGVTFPRLFRRFDLTYEVSEWQNNWYIHGIYRDGLTNHGQVIGHWGADQRVPNADLGARTQMINLGWHPSWGGLLELRGRTIQNQDYTTTQYERGYDMSVRYAHPVHDFIVGGEVFAGKDVFGEDFSRVSAFVRYAPQSRDYFSMLADSEAQSVEVEGLEVFVDAGANANRVDIDLEDAVPVVTTKTSTAPHFAIGARRAISDRSDLGVRVEYDEVDGHALIGARALDYRYRFGDHLAAGAFLGAARYDVETPAYGFYGGFGAQWRNVLPSWDVGADLRYAVKVARDHVLTTDPRSVRPDSFYDIASATLYITKRF